ncbi:MAG: glycosyltransferase [Inquilinus limosus]|uniref:Glycosyltransferase n=1 Tax=Inquilinus limosus TaxID=171674 RepID=A0A952KFF1_9PROT|nr:glycosyltransferase [Inquilinus limosus]
MMGSEAAPAAASLPSADPLREHLSNRRVRMRIAVCDYAGHPFQIQLSRHLASRGHQVLHLYFADLVGPKGAIQRLPDDPQGFAIEGLTAGGHVDRTDLLRRRQQEARAGEIFAARCKAFAPDAVISSNMPLDALPSLQREARRGDAMFIFWLQDIISVAMEKILGRRGYFYRLVSKYYGLRERRALRRSDAIVAISDDFLPILRRWRIDPARISIIPNWAPIGDIPVGRKRNDWSRKYGRPKSDSAVSPTCR